MKNGNLVVAAVREPTARVTRAAARQSSGGMLMLDVSKQQDHKRVLRKNSKRAAWDERNSGAPVTACFQHKRRAVLKDVTNVCCDNSYRNCLNAAKIPKKNGNQAKKGSVDVSMVAPSVAPKVQQNSRTKIGQEKTEPQSAEVVWSLILDKKTHLEPSTESAEKFCGIDSPCHDEQHSGTHSQVKSFSKKEEKVSLYEKLITCTKPEFTDIDSDHKDPQLCSHYAPDIYNNLHVAELMQKPHSNSMEIVQRELTQSMRGILVDWLVEVCEEYKLASDTLYFAVHLVDLFLSQYFIERQRLQLLGITCMLIASKYEEICAPRVEEFCFIIDNTYSKTEVLKMESQVLNDLRFQLSAPTAKTFLRYNGDFYKRHKLLTTYKIPSLELELLANYLTELTLVDYSFLKFIPSNVAASAVFLARWMLDQSRHPWNPTLEHYTSYVASDLKTTVVALQALQLNTSGCPLNAIRAKYRQDKFKSVASLSSPKLLETLF